MSPAPTLTLAPPPSSSSASRSNNYPGQPTNILGLPESDRTPGSGTASSDSLGSSGSVATASPRASPTVRTLRRKLVVVGDGAAGKTSLLVAYKEGKFSADYTPTVFENSIASVPVEDRLVELSLWDTAGQEDYDRLRPLSYPDTHVILICYSVDKPESLRNVLHKWIYELDQYCPGVPRILVACKTDLRSEHGAAAVTGESFTSTEAVRRRLPINRAAR